MSAATETQSSVRAKEFHFPLTVGWVGERRVAASVEGKPAIEITPPPVFRGTDPTTGARKTSSSPQPPRASPSPSPASPPKQA